MDVIEELKFLGNFTHKNFFWWGGGGSGGGELDWAGQGGCERRIDVFGKIYKKKIGGGGGGGVGKAGGQVGGGRVGGGRGQGGCERNVGGRG